MDVRPSPRIGAIFQPVASPMSQKAVTALTTFASGHGFSRLSGTGTQSDDTVNFIRGSQSLKLVTDGAGGACFSAKKNISPTLDVSSKHFKIRVMVDKPANVVELFIYLSSDNLTSNWITLKPSDDYSVMKPGVWTTLTFSDGGRNSAPTGSPTLSAINALQVRIKDDATTAVTLNIQEIATFAPPAAGVCSITFDDGRISQWNVAKPIMDAYAFPGTMYVYPSVIGNGTHVSKAQLATMQELNWDVSSHTYSHPHLSQLDDGSIHEQFRRSKEWLVQNGFAKGANDLALPYGDYNDTNVLPIAKQYFRSVRTITNQVETLPPASTYKIRTLYVINTMTLATAEAAVADAVTNKEWLVMVFHDIVTTPAIDVEWATSDFTTLMAYVATQGLAVRTISDVLNG